MAQDGNRGRDGSGTMGGERRGRGGPLHGHGRYGAAYDQERIGYGGQEYGLEGGHRTTSDRDRAWRGDEREVDQRDRWRPGNGEPYGELELNPRNRGTQEFGPPADYAYHPHMGPEFDREYLDWREAKMRGHDRAYQAWRRERERRYDDDYRRTRGGGEH